MIHKFLRIGGMTLEDPFLYLVIHVQPLFHLCYIHIYIYPDFRSTLSRSLLSNHWDNP